MHKLLRLYSQNRIKVWAAILAIILGIAMIQVLNAATKEEKKANKEVEEETTLNNVVSYDKQSNSIVSSGSVSEAYKDKIGQIIDTFYTYCVNHEPEKAYDMLSSEMKSLKYPNEQIFKEGYYQNKFSGDMQYLFQSWSTSKGKYTYVVNIYENMLSTGKTSKESYIEDYITVVPEEDTYKINVDGYIGKNEINKQCTNNLVTVEAYYSEIYMNYEIYTFSVKNNTDKTILLDSMENTKNTYIVDDKENKYDALIYENKKEDLILEPNEISTIKIKFSNAYRTTLDIKEINFTKILDYEQYKINKEIQAEVIKIEI